MRSLVAFALWAVLLYGAAQAYDDDALKRGDGAVVLNLPAPTASVLPRPLSLGAALRLALEQSHAVRAGQLDRRVQREELAVAEAEFTPKFSFGGQIDRPAGGGPPTSTLTAGSTWKWASGAQLELARDRLKSGAQDAAGAASFQTTLQWVQPLLKGNASVATLALQNARLAEAVNRFQYEQFLSDTVAAVVLAYFDVIQADAQTALAVLSLQQSQQIGDINKGLYQAGRLAQRDLLQAELDISQNELALAQVRNIADQAKRNLVQFLGPMAAGAPTEQLLLAEGLPAIDDSSVEESVAVAQALAGRQDLKVAELAMSMARTVVVQADNDSLPQVDLVASLQPVVRDGAVVDAARQTQALAVGLRWTVPLERAPLQLQRSRAQAGMQKAEWAIQDLRLTIGNQVTSAVRDLRSAELQLSLAKRSLDLAEQRLNTELQKLKAGRSSAFELSATQDTLKRTQVALSDAQLAVPRARVQLQRVTGQVLPRWLPPGMELTSQ